MPIFAGPIVPAPPEAPPPVVVPEVGYASISYIDPRGTVWPMTDTSLGFYALADGVSGLGAAPVSLTTDPLPRGGVRLRHVQPQARTIVWPVHVSGTTHQEFIDLWRALAKAFTDTLRYGPGVLHIARPDGRQRQIKVRYQDGWDGLGRAGTGISWDNAVITLLAEDPYYYDPVPQEIHRQTDTVANFLNPYPSVSSSQVLGATTVTNPGDVAAWPVWTITGPATLVTITNDDTGESFTLDPNAAAIGHGNLLAGEYVTVATDPPSVRYSDGSNWVGSLNWPAASLWSLAPGDNALTFELDGAGVDSAVDLSFYPRYETA